MPRDRSPRDGQNAVMTSHCCMAPRSSSDKREVNMKLFAAIFLFATAAFAADPCIPTDAERARWTLQDMKSWMIVFDAYKLDHNEYPHVATPEEARAIGEPVYIRHAPMNDAWGRPYRIEADGRTFRVISAGADG